MNRERGGHPIEYLFQVGKWLLYLLLLALGTIALLDFMPSTRSSQVTYHCLRCDRAVTHTFYCNALVGRIKVKTNAYGRAGNSLDMSLLSQFGWGTKPHDHLFGWALSDGSRGFFLSRSSGAHGRGPFVTHDMKVAELAPQIRKIGAWSGDFARELIQAPIVTLSYHTIFGLLKGCDPEKFNMDVEAFEANLEKAAESREQFEKLRPELERIMRQYSDPTWFLQE